MHGLGGRRRKLASRSLPRHDRLDGRPLGQRESEVRKVRKRVLALAVGLLLVASLAIQLVPYGRAHDNPPVISEPQWDSPRTRELFFTTCGDCHSNETRWPWYSNIAPISWLVQRDVDEGRAACNVSEWGQAKQDCGDSAETLAGGSMPPRSYVLLHPSAPRRGGAGCAHSGAPRHVRRRRRKA